MCVNDVLSKKRYIGEEGAGDSNRLFKSEWYSFRRLYAGRKKAGVLWQKQKKEAGYLSFLYYPHHYYISDFYAVVYFAASVLGIVSFMCSCGRGGVLPDKPGR